jgi:drug/metabolite transporter (DMT)-like permease
MFNALYVILGAGLWATDTLFRHPMVHQLSALTIVYLEHLFAVAITGVWVLTFHRRRLFMGFNQTAGALFIGVFGSAIATLLFTLSFQFVNPSVSILLQKTQPIVVIVLSALFLGEKLNSRFWLWSLVALAAAFFISFPHGLNLNDLSSSDTKGTLFALAAAALWAISTVVGKAVLKDAIGPVLSFWRFFFGFVVLFIYARMTTQTRIELPFVFNDTGILKSIFIMALVPGVIAVTLYYRGLSRVPASVATILELSFPLCAMWINSHYLDLHLENIQIVAAGVLLLAMIQVGRDTGL